VTRCTRAVVWPGSGAVARSTRSAPPSRPPPSAPSARTAPVTLRARI